MLLKLSKQNLFILGALLATGTLILLTTAFAPFAREPLVMDNGAYVYVAKEILNGQLPYRDVLDHKGPFLYLINVLGLALAGGNLAGIWLLEIISLFTAGIFMFRTARLFSFSRATALLGTLSALLFLAPLLTAGDTTEEWALPFISIATFIFLRLFFFRFNNTPLPFRRRLFFYFILAASFVLVLFLKPTLVAAWCGLGAVVLIKLPAQKQLKELYSALSYIALFVLLSITPFALYFLFTGTLSDAFYGVFYFNFFEYKFNAPAGIALEWLLRKHWFYLIVPAVSVFYFAWSAFLKKSANTNEQKIETKFAAGGILTALFTSSAACLLGGGFGYYLIILAPFFAITLASLWNAIFRHRHLVLTCALFIALNTAPAIALFKGVWKNYTDTEFRPSQLHFLPNENRVKFKKLIAAIHELSTPEDRILVRGYASYIYVHAGRRCAGNFPYPLIGSSRVHTHYAADAARNLPKLIIQGTGVQTAPDMLSLAPLLSTHYTLARHIGDIEIWKLNRSAKKINHAL